MHWSFAFISAESPRDVVCRAVVGGVGEELIGREKRNRWTSGCFTSGWLSTWPGVRRGGLQPNPNEIDQAINKGIADGLDTGSVLAIYRANAPIADPRPPTGAPVLQWAQEQTRFLLPPRPDLPVPDERTGLVFVFRVFDRVSYGIVLNTTDPVFIGDFVQTFFKLKYNFLLKV
jgi:hypothetical protein